MRTILPAVSALALFTACHSAAVPKDAELPALTVDQVQALVASGQATVFDNNSKERFEESHVPGAKWLSFKDVKASDLPEDKARTLVFYCANEH